MCEAIDVVGMSAEQREREREEGGVKEEAKERKGKRERTCNYEKPVITKTRG